MPNWCLNKLTIEHDDPAMIQQAARAFNEGALLNFFIPCPLELLDDDLESYGGKRAEELDAKRAAMKEKTGWRSWYEWALANWGCKWDVFGEGIDPVDLPVGSHSLTLSFETPWSPPIEAMEAAEEKGFSVRLFYYEPGMGFAGCWEDGRDNFLEDTGNSLSELFLSQAFEAPETLVGQEVSLG